MRITVTGDSFDEEVIAEPFNINGSGEFFAVHRSIGDDPKCKYSATHVDTGFAIAHGDTIDEAIEAGRTAWMAASPEQRTAACARAIAIRQARHYMQSEVLA